MLQWLPASTAGLLLATGLVLSGTLAFAAYTIVLRPLSQLEPVVSVAAAVTWLGERVAAATIAGGLLILAGVAIASTAWFSDPVS